MRAIVSQRHLAGFSTGLFVAEEKVEKMESWKIGKIEK